MHSPTQRVSQLAFARRAGVDVHAVLARTLGVDWIAPHRALLRGARGAIEFTIADEQSAYLDVLVSPALSPRAQLERSRSLPGNLRFTRTAAGTCLRAELHIATGAQLDRAVAQLARGIDAALAASLPQTQQVGTTADVDSGRLVTALRETCWRDDGVVELEGAWEVRPRVQGFVAPVRVTPAAGGVRLSREVVQVVPRDALGDALIDAALRMQAALRFARLALEADGLCAETQLDTLEIEPRALEIAARAVATASRAAQAQVPLLLENACVASCYAVALLRPTRNSARGLSP